MTCVCWLSVCETFHTSTVEVLISEGTAVFAQSVLKRVEPSATYRMKHSQQAHITTSGSARFSTTQRSDKKSDFVPTKCLGFFRRTLVDDTPKQYGIAQYGTILSISPRTHTPSYKPVFVRVYLRSPGKNVAVPHDQASRCPCTRTPDCCGAGQRRMTTCAVGWMF